MGKRRGRGGRKGEGAGRTAPWPLARFTRLEPSVLLRGEDDQLGRFFLSIALAYNDLKGLVVFEGYLLERGRPAADLVEPSAGQWHGIMVQIHRSIAGVLHEVLVLIEKQAALVDGSELRALLDAIPDEHQRSWRDLVRLARKETEQDKARQGLMLRIRNAIAFHYYQPKVLARGFERFFKEEPRTGKNEAALASLGHNMEQTRFHYADAAAQAAMFAIGDDRKLPAADEEVVQLAKTVNEALGPLLFSFIESRLAGHE